MLLPECGRCLWENLFHGRACIQPIPQIFGVKRFRQSAFVNRASVGDPHYTVEKLCTQFTTELNGALPGVILFVV